MNPVKIGAAALAIAIATLAVPATLQAADRPLVVEGDASVPTAYVSFRDLNLAEASQVGQLKARVRRAATRLCFGDSDLPLDREMIAFQCRADAIEGAKDQVELAIANAGNARYAAVARVTVTLR